MLTDIKHQRSCTMGDRNYADELALDGNTGGHSNEEQMYTFFFFPLIFSRNNPHALHASSGL